MLPRIFLGETMGQPQFIEALEPRRLLASATQILGSPVTNGTDPEAVVIGDKTIATFEYGLWSGTGTTLSPVNTFAQLGDVDHLVARKGLVFFEGSVNYSGTTVMSYNPATGELRTDLGASPGMYYQYFATAGDTLYAVGETDHYHPNGMHLYVYNDVAGQFQEMRTPKNAPVIDWDTKLFEFRGQLHYVGTSGDLMRVDILPSGAASISKVVHLPVTPYWIRGDVGGYLYYEVSDPSGQLWRTDGTTAGTFAFPSDLQNISGLAAFKRTAWFTNSETLYRVDRTTGQPVASMQVPYPTSVYSLGDKLILEIGDTLYVSDGTTAGTRPLAAMADVQSTPWRIYNGFAIVRGKDADHGDEIWVTDGTDAGTTLFDFNPGPEDSYDLGSVSHTGQPYVVAIGPQGWGWYRINVSAQNHAPVAATAGSFTVREGLRLHLDASATTDADGDALTYEWDLNNDGDFTDFVTTDAVTSVAWKVVQKAGISDGPATFHGRVRVRDVFSSSTSSQFTINVTNTAPAASVAIPQQIVAGSQWSPPISFLDRGRDTVQSFKVEWGDGSSTNYLGTDTSISHKYSTPGAYPLKITATDEDGTATALTTSINVVSAIHGTAKLSSIFSSHESPLLTSAELNGYLYYPAVHPTYGVSLYRTDGTEYGEQLVAPTQHISTMTVAGNYLYFVRHNSQVYDKPPELWRSDGTGAGTIKLLTGESIGAYNLIALNNKVYFIAVPTGGTEFSLYSTDGTRTGTKRISPLTVFVSNPVLFNGAIYFIGAKSTAPNDRLLYRSDGTTVTPVASLYSDDDSPNLFLSGDKMYIERDSFANISDDEGQIWHSDGTAEGTFIVRARSKARVIYKSYYQGDNTLFFVASNTGDANTTGDELWAIGSDGKARLLRDIRPGRQSSNIAFWCNLNGYTYFTASDGTHGVELWRSNGSGEGTQLVADLTPGATSTEFQNIFANGPQLFLATYNAGVKESAALWRTDGTLAGTLRLTDRSSVVTHLAKLGSRTLFATQLTDGANWQWWSTNGKRGGTYALPNITAPSPKIGLVTYNIGGRTIIQSSQGEQFPEPGTDDLWQVYG